MSVVLPDLQPWQERLRTLLAEQAIRVAGAAEMASAMAEGTPAPALYLLEERAGAEPNRSMVGVVQTVERVVSIHYAIDNQSDASVAQLGSLRATVMGALLGWTPPDCSHQIQFVEGQLTAFDTDLLWWQDQFKTQFRLHHIHP